MGLFFGSHIQSGVWSSYVPKESANSSWENKGRSSYHVTENYVLHSLSVIFMEIIFIVSIFVLDLETVNPPNRLICLWKCGFVWLDFAFLANSITVCWHKEPWLNSCSFFADRGSAVVCGIDLAQWYRGSKPVTGKDNPSAIRWFVEKKKKNSFIHLWSHLHLFVSQFFRNFSFFPSFFSKFFDTNGERRRKIIEVSKSQWKKKKKNLLH